MRIDNCPICGAPLIVKEVNSYTTFSCSSINIIKQKDKDVYQRFNCFSISENFSIGEPLRIERQIEYHNMLLKMQLEENDCNCIMIGSNIISNDFDLINKLIWLPEKDLIPKLQTIITFT